MGEIWRVGGGTDLTDFFSSFFSMLSRGSLSIEATSLFLFACAASFGNMDNDIAKQ